MFDRFLRRKPAPLTGAPETARLKTYSAQSGYVYRYYYLGFRSAKRIEGRGAEYVFNVGAGRDDYTPVAVFIPDRAAASWEARKGRALIPAERYAIAKMALFQAFDESAGPGDVRAGVLVRPADLDAILDTLGID